MQEIRSATGWSEPLLAREIGVSQPTVHRILKGQADCKASTLRAIEALHARTVFTEPHHAMRVQGPGPGAPAASGSDVQSQCLADQSGFAVSVASSP
ncbi:helix-turn-helix domain-containing protein [Herbaspirillum sp. B65]|uniref:helix-turn-helix domain-containing protein n=1 Tax=Herbaspirillum sp. B65 TaxID=137708 RepID=UPI0035B56016